MFSKINEYLSECQQELIGIHETDSSPVKEYITFFTNHNSLDSWYNTERKIKILLSTAGSSPEGAFMRLFNLSPALSKLGIEVAIAYMSISTNFSLAIKVKENSRNYLPEDINRVLSILSVLIGFGSQMETLFYSLNASLFEHKLPLNESELIHINTLIDTLLKCKNVIICESRIETLHRITKNDHFWKFFIPLEAPFTALESVEKLRVLSTESVFNDLKCEWIVGSLGIKNCASAPLLIAIYNSKIIAICLDNLDILILVQMLNSLSDNKQLENHFSVLSNLQNKKSFYCD